MTADQIATIRNLRAFNVDWPIIAKTVKEPVEQCREALGLPTYAEAGERVALPWEQRQRTLFDGQPSMDGVSDK